MAAIAALLTMIYVIIMMVIIEIVANNDIPKQYSIILVIVLAVVALILFAIIDYMTMKFAGKAILLGTNTFQSWTGSLAEMEIGREVIKNRNTNIYKGRQLW